MKTSKILSMAAGLMLLSACNSDELDEFAGRIPINLGYETLTVEEATRTAASTTINDSYITSGDNVMVKIKNYSTAVGNYVPYTYQAGASGTMTPPSPKPYYPTGSTNIDILAYYPSTAGNSSNFDVNADQTSDTNYKASDLMVATKTNQAKTTSTVSLAFQHKMAKLVVTATKGDGVNGIKTITLKQVKRQVSFTNTSGDVGSAQTISGATDVIVFKGGSDTNASGIGAALIPAQTITGNILEIETDQGTATYSVASPGKTFNANTKYTVNVTVNRTAVGITNSITWGSEASLTVNPTTTVVQKTPVGLEAVDLGLSSGLKWANMNVGATSETDYGLYFAWGETTGYTSDTSDGRSFNWTSYDLGNSSSNLYMYNSTDGLTTLKMSDDAARANWGGNWRMPTQTEFQELLDNTTNEWVTDPAPGWKFTSKASGNTNSIFLPAAGYRYDARVNSQGSYGYYWSSSLRADRPYGAWYLSFLSGGAGMNNISRYYGYSVRAVQ
ncbi:MAG: fimbrillin family protein [Prevotella sp.]|nr:fimbrillin family protein [Prevotella sp.]